MANIAFYANNLTERGTAVALFDYARYSREILGNTSLILYDERYEGNDARVIEKFQTEFEVIPSSDFTEADRHITQAGCDLLYVIKSGARDDLLSKVVRTMVHSVFPTSVRHVHGAAYAFVSEWLAKECSRNLLPWVPHIVSIGKSDDDMRSELGIPEEALVFGCYGGRDSFDIDFVKNIVIPYVLETLPSVWFVFMNIEPFIDDSRVLFLPKSVDVEVKTVFINSCDAMIHARLRGETFGIAVGEFSLCGKPVLTFGQSRERAHLDALGTSALVYRTPEALHELITQFDRSAPSAKETYRALFSPEPVMEMFTNNLIKPAETHGFNGARNRLGLRACDPTLLVRPKLNKWFYSG